jgi:hypothetical protein
LFVKNFIELEKRLRHGKFGNILLIKFQKWHAQLLTEKSTRQIFVNGGGNAALQTDFCFRPKNVFLV